MGITARGAWESVKRHFRSFGHKTTQNHNHSRWQVSAICRATCLVTVCLLSEQPPGRRIIAIFTTHHPMSHPLFNLPRSSWDDYDKSLISKGGGVYPRTAKSISLSPEACAVLGITTAELTPVELLKAIPASTGRSLVQRRYRYLRQSHLRNACPSRRQSRRCFPRQW